MKMEEIVQRLSHCKCLSENSGIKKREENKKCVFSVIAFIINRSQKKRGCTFHSTKIRVFKLFKCLVYLCTLVIKLMCL